MVQDIAQIRKNWVQPALPEEIPHGDMPGDKVEIGEEHIAKAKTVFPVLLEEMERILETGQEKIAITVCGGSGVGKSEIASLLAYFFNEAGIGAYVMSGDNYPHRIPKYNDAERLWVFREGGVRQMAADGVLTEENRTLLRQFQEQESDADPAHMADYPWMERYLSGGRKALEGYLGTKRESDFEEVEQIVSAFHAGKTDIWLRRMGRIETELWYDPVDFSGIRVLIIEWTHGNSDCYEGIDIPVLLNSTPEETLAHRRSRNRDGKTDSPFTTLVLEIEQERLKTQAHKAKVIVAKSGELLSYEAYCRQMESGKETKE